MDKREKETGAFMKDPSQTSFVQIIGGGTEEDPYIISDADAFKGICNNLSAFYKLAADIDFNGETITPIGTMGLPFTGGLDGDGYAVRRFQVNGGDFNIGLFGTTRSAKFTNLAIEHVEIRQSSTVYNIGALVGFENACTISNIFLSDIVISGDTGIGALAGVAFGGNFAGCAVGGTVSISGNGGIGGLIGQTLGGVAITGCRVTGDGMVIGARSTGGLVGELSGNTEDERFAGKIYDCYAGIKINGGDETGGLVGWLLDGNTKIIESCATGDVWGRAYVGGLAGRVEGSMISDSFATGNVVSVTGDAYTGGLAGHTISSSITNCYAAGKISAGGSGLIYVDSMTAASGSYYDGRVAEVIAANSYNVGKLTMALIRKAFYPGWDFDGVWDIREGYTYPYLRKIGEPDWQAIDIASLPAGAGTEEEPWLLRDAKEFGYIKYDVSGFYKLASDIDLEGETILPAGTIDVGFTGGLDGDAHAIRNFEVIATEPYTGLFGVVRSGKLKNLVLENGAVQQPSSAYRIGALAGFMANCTVENISLSDITVSGGSGVGALVGEVFGGSLTDCSVRGNVSINGSAGIGGLAGLTLAATITDCLVTGNGTVNSGGSAGGLVGEMTGNTEEERFGGKICGCCAAIEVNGGEVTGGLVGWLLGGNNKISESCATGDVSGKAYVGGLAGRVEGTVISDSYATGNVASSDGSVYTGGLAGHTTSSDINNCYAAVRMYSGGSGLVYVSSSTSISNSYFDSSLSGITAQPVLARTTEQLLRKETYIDWDWDNCWNARDNSYPELKKIKEVFYQSPFELIYYHLTSSSVIIVCPDIPGATGYEISYLDKMTVSDVHETLIEGLTQNTRYEFRARVRGGGVKGVWSFPLIVDTKQAFSLDGIHTISKGVDSLTLTWNRVDGAERYEVICGNSIHLTDTNTYTITGLTADTSYVIRIRAILNDGSILSGSPVTEKIYTLDPQTDYAAEFILKCVGQTWFQDEIENLLNLQGRSINTLSAKADLSAIYAIGLADRGISGSIPPAIGELSSLQYLYLGRNNLSGQLPEELAALDRMIEMDLSGNHFSDLGSNQRTSEQAR